MYHETKLNIEWSSEGEWNFMMGNQDIVKIRGGVKSSLGFQGGELFLLEGRGELFLLEGREVTIDDFKIDLEGKQIVFHGTCSSSKTPSGRQLKSVFTFTKFGHMDIVKIKSEVFGDIVGGLQQFKFKDRIYSKQE